MVSKSRRLCLPCRDVSVHRLDLTLFELRALGFDFVITDLRRRRFGVLLDYE